MPSKVFIISESEFITRSDSDSSDSDTRGGVTFGEYLPKSLGKSVGETAVGEKSVGEKSVEEKSVEEKSVEEKSVEEKSVGEKSVRETSVGEKSVGEKSVGETSVGETSVGETAVREKSVGEMAVGEKSVGEKFVGETAVGETSVGETAVGEKSGGLHTPIFFFENLYAPPEQSVEFVEPEREEPEREEPEYWCPHTVCHEKSLGRVKFLYNLVRHFNNHHSQIPKESQFYPRMANIEVFKSHEAFDIYDETYAPVEITPMDINPSDFVKTEVDDSAEVDPLQCESSLEMDASAEIVPPQAEPSDILFSSSPVATEPVINLFKITPLNSSENSKNSSNSFITLSSLSSSKHEDPKTSSPFASFNISPSSAPLFDLSPDRLFNPSPAPDPELVAEFSPSPAPEIFPSPARNAEFSPARDTEFSPARDTEFSPARDSEFSPSPAPKTKNCRVNIEKCTINIKECGVKIKRLSCSPATTSSSRCTVNIIKFDSFPESGGVYPHQAAKLKNDFFPGRNDINSEDIKKKRDESQEFAAFFNDLVEHKKRQGNKGTRTFYEQAIITIKLVIKGQSGGKKVIPQKVKNYFKNNVNGTLKNFKIENKDDPEFIQNYQIVRENCKDDNTADTTIRRFLEK